MKMKKQLFFDDRYIFVRENVIRKYGKPEVIAKYKDEACSTDFMSGWVFRLDDGRYRMLYFGHGSKFNGKKYFSAISEDGINFERVADLEFGAVRLVNPRPFKAARIVCDETAIGGSDIRISAPLIYPKY